MLGRLTNNSRAEGFGEGSRSQVDSIVGSDLREPGARLVTQTSNSSGCQCLRSPPHAAVSSKALKPGTCIAI